MENREGLKNAINNLCNAKTNEDIKKYRDILLGSLCNFIALSKEYDKNNNIHVANILAAFNALQFVKVKESDQNSAPLSSEKESYMGTVEPDWTNKREFAGDGIKDDALGFIYGAIKKYGSYPKCYPELKDYIKMMGERIGDRVS